MPIKQLPSLKKAWFDFVPSQLMFSEWLVLTHKKCWSVGRGGWQVVGSTVSVRSADSQHKPAPYRSWQDSQVRLLVGCKCSITFLRMPQTTIFVRLFANRSDAILFNPYNCMDWRFLYENVSCNIIFIVSEINLLTLNQ